MEKNFRLQLIKFVWIGGELWDNGCCKIANKLFNQLISNKIWKNIRSRRTRYMDIRA